MVRFIGIISLYFAIAIQCSVSPAESLLDANLESVGLIGAKSAFLAYVVLAVLAIVTLDGDALKVSLAVLALFAVKTYIDILRRRMAEREAAEAAAASLPAAPAGDVRPGGDS